MGREWGQAFFPWICRMCNIEGETFAGYNEHVHYHVMGMDLQPSLEEEQAAAVAEAELILNGKV